MTAPRLLVLADDLIWSTRLEGQGRTLGADVQRFTTTEPLIAAGAVRAMPYRALFERGHAILAGLLDLPVPPATSPVTTEEGA